MKIKSIHILYRLSAFLSDKTNGFSLFAKWKIALGGLLLSATITSCQKSDKENISETDTIQKEKSVTVNLIKIEVPEPPPPPVEISALCYFMVPEISKRDTADTPVTTQKQKESVGETEHELSNRIETIVEVKASFEGGNKALNEFLQKNLIYPENAKQDNIQGRVVCRFVIDKDGSISGVKIVKSLSNECDQEAIRLINLMPKWVPASISGENVSSYYNQPIDFILSKDAK